MKIIACGDSYTLGEGLNKSEQVYVSLVAKYFNAEFINLSQSGASEFLITEQVEEAIKQKPDLIIIGHTSEYRWQVRDKRTGWWQGFIVANWIQKNKKSYKNWILSEQLLDNTRKTPEHFAAWHAAGMLYYSEEKVIRRLWKGAIALQCTIINNHNIDQIHFCCFDHLQSDLECITNKFINFPLDKLKHKEFAPDGSHAGPNLHKLLAKKLINHINQLH